MKYPFFNVSLLLVFFLGTHAKGATPLTCEDVAPNEDTGTFLELCNTATTIQKENLTVPIETTVSRCEKAREQFKDQANLFHYLEFQVRLQGPQPNTALRHLQALETSVLGPHTQSMWEAHWTKQKRLPPNTATISPKLLKNHPELVARYISENPTDLNVKSQKSVLALGLYSSSAI